MSKINTVEPIRDIAQLERLKALLRAQSERNYMIAQIGINTGLRYSDIAALRARDVVGCDHIVQREQKTGKERRFPLNASLRKELAEYCHTMHLESDDYLFASRNRDPVTGQRRPLGRVQAYYVIRNTARRLGLRHIGIHSLRKTFGYHFYQRTKDVATLMMIFNHASPAITLRYIGITQDMIDRKVKGFRL